MTPEQIWKVDQLFSYDLVTMWAHHGDCIGADADFHRLAELNGLKTHGHPPINSSKRAFCKFDVIEEPKEYLDRNKDIVDAVDWMIFTPETKEEVLRSGTWSTVRYARKQKKPYIIVFPDGSVEDKRGEVLG